MLKLLSVLIMLLLTATTHAQTNKQAAYSAIQQFFNITQQQLVLTGHFVDTDPDYGETCIIKLDFTTQGKEYLTLTGEYTPAGNLGDGIYFQEAPGSFQRITVNSDMLSVEQRIKDSFSTNTTSKIELKKINNTLRFSLYQQSYFLFIPQSVEKSCKINNYVHL